MDLFFAHWKDILGGFVLVTSTSMVVTGLFTNNDKLTATFLPVMSGSIFWLGMKF